MASMRSQTLAARILSAYTTGFPEFQKWLNISPTHF